MIINYTNLYWEIDIKSSSGGYIINLKISSNHDMMLNFKLIN
jgi:hypothetical protein